MQIIPERAVISDEGRCWSCPSAGAAKLLRGEKSFGKAMFGDHWWSWNSGMQGLLWLGVATPWQCPAHVPARCSDVHGNWRRGWWC